MARRSHTAARMMAAKNARLEARFQQAFHEGARARGRALVRRRRVELLDFDETVACARVRAPDQVYVTLVGDDEALHACTCHDATDRPRCAHVWAAILVADRERKARRAAKRDAESTG